MGQDLLITDYRSLITEVQGSGQIVDDIKQYAYDIKRGADIYRMIAFSRLKKWICSGKVLRRQILVWRPGLSGWRRPEELPELSRFFEEDCEKRELEPDILEEKRKTVPLKKKKRRIKNILIVDDEEDLCVILSDALSAKGYHVSVANTQKDAVTCMKNERQDVILLDLNLPNGNGLKLISKIKEINPDTVINVITAYSIEKKDAMKKGVFTFIEKPFTEKDILKVLKKISA